MILIKYRHSREGGNPSPAIDYSKLGCLVLHSPVMDSRLRGNDGVVRNGVLE
jgi:hypothetical protein